MRNEAQLCEGGPSGRVSFLFRPQASSLFYYRRLDGDTAARRAHFALVGRWLSVEFSPRPADSGLQIATSKTSLHGSDHLQWRCRWGARVGLLTDRQGFIVGVDQVLELIVSSLPLQNVHSTPNTRE